MCQMFGGDSGKNMRRQQIFETGVNAQAKAEQDAQAEQQRQRLLQQSQLQQDNIATGKSSIDNALAGFNEDWYGQAAQRYQDAYTPQIDYQANSALDKLKSALAGRGMLESTVGAKAISDLAGQTADARAKVANDAIDFTNGLRSKVNDTRSSLLAQNAAAADPSAIASAATGQASSIANQGGIAPTTPLGDIFSSFLTPFIGAAAASQNSLGGLAPSGGVKTPKLDGNGSAKTVY